jgi:hypothetical protein
LGSWNDRQATFSFGGAALDQASPFGFADWTPSSFGLDDNDEEAAAAAAAAAAMSGATMSDGGDDALPTSSSSASALNASSGHVAVKSEPLDDSALFGSAGAEWLAPPTPVAMMAPLTSSNFNLFQPRFNSSSTTAATSNATTTTNTPRRAPAFSAHRRSSATGAANYSSSSGAAAAAFDVLNRDGTLLFGARHQSPPNSSTSTMRNGTTSMSLGPAQRAASLVTRWLEPSSEPSVDPRRIDAPPAPLLHDPFTDCMELSSEFDVAAAARSARRAVLHKATQAAQASPATTRVAKRAVRGLSSRGKKF